MQFVADPGALRQAGAALSGEKVFYLDTEFDSSRDGTVLCLVQVTAGAEVFLIDALKLEAVAELGAVLGASDATWVLHAGQQDVPLLSAWLGIGAPRLFDTQLAWSLLSIEHSTSLAYLKYRLLGRRGEKAYQADDWRRRPLPEAQLAYAAEDVLHLPEIYRELLLKSERLGRTQAIFDASAEGLSPNPEASAPLRVDAFRNAWQLEPEGQAVLTYLIDWYNALDDDEREIAPDLKGLFSIASRRPKSLDDLSGMRAVPRRAFSRFGKVLVAGVAQAVARAKSAEFSLIEPPPYAIPEEILASGWLEAARAELCTELEVAPELVLPSRLMRRLRDAAVAAGDLRGALDALAGWRRALLLEPLARKIERFGPRLEIAR
jgi:ribonuclease D